MIGIGLIQPKENHWIAFAIEIKNNSLVACTSSNQSENKAKESVKETLRRFRRLHEYDETKSVSKSSQIGTRLAQLREGKGRPFSLKEISQKNWSLARLSISEQLLKVPRGKVISYGNLARLSNSSPRGVGSVMRSNPVPWAVPCHRVIHSDGTLGKLGGTISGTPEKARILRAEGVIVRDTGTVDQKSVLI
ncbi:MAG: MGMT family protein [Promethearchaeota archaeon]